MQVFNNSGDIVFPGLLRLKTGKLPGRAFGEGIFLADRNDGISKVVAPDDPAPGGRVFDYTTNPWINDQRDVAFGAHVEGEECITILAFGPACAESIYLKSGSTGPIASIAHQGEPARRRRPLSIRVGTCAEQPRRHRIHGRSDPAAEHSDNYRNVFALPRRRTIAIAPLGMRCRAAAGFGP